MKTYKSFELMFEVLTTIETEVGEMFLYEYFMWREGFYMIISKGESDEDYVDAMRIDERETIPTGFDRDMKVTPVVRRRTL